MIRRHTRTPDALDLEDDFDDYGADDDTAAGMLPIDADPRTHGAPTATGREAKRVLWAGATAWTAAEILHVTGLPGHDIMVGTLVFASASLLSGSKNHPVGARRLAVAGLITGAWVTVATGAHSGVFGGPFGKPTLTMAWALTVAIAWWWVNHLPSIMYARQWAAQKEEWQHKASAWKLHGALLLNQWKTRLGEAYLLDTEGTGKLASNLASSAGTLAEKIAEAEGLRPSQIHISIPRNARAARLMISIRYRNPWKRDIPHPSLAADHEIELAGLNEATCHDPFEVGQDPETGRLLTLPVWTKQGARVAYLLATRGGGKSTMLNDIYERGTACRDVIVVGINLDKASELRDWAPACHLTAIGPDQVGRAVKILRLIKQIRIWRAANRDTHGGNRNFTPDRKHPLILVIIDEIDVAAKYAAVRELLTNAYSKDRSEGVAWVTAGQRGTADWMGGADLRTLVDTFAVGKVQRDTETSLLLGQQGMWMPDMSTYGQGQPGVWGLIPDQGAAPDLGRAFNLESTEDIEYLVKERAFAQPSLEAGLAEHLGDEYEQLLGSDVFARWARDPDGQGGPFTPTPATIPEDTPGGYSADPSPAETATAVLDRPGTQPQDPFTEWQREMTEQIPGLHDIVASMGGKFTEAQRLLDATPADPDDDGLQVSPEQMAAATAQLWEEMAAKINIPPDKYKIIVNHLVRGGISARDLATRLGVGKTTATGYLQKIRIQGHAEVTGKGAAMKWVWAGQIPGGFATGPAGGDGA